MRKPLLKVLVMIIALWMGIPEEQHCLQKCITPKVRMSRLILSTSKMSFELFYWNDASLTVTMYFFPAVFFIGQEGSVCLRSSDCATGLCCARHFWSKICKPVLKEGQVCTKHRRKGSHGLEIFQRCYCGEGLSCRIQKDHHQASNSSRLHTCQRH